MEPPTKTSRFKTNIKPEYQTIVPAAKLLTNFIFLLLLLSLDGSSETERADSSDANVRKSLKQTDLSTDQGPLGQGRFAGYFD